MISSRPLAGVILASALLTGAAAAPAAASTAQPQAEVEAAAARPANGKVLYAGLIGGRGKLKVKNGLSSDAVFTLVRGKKKAVTFYVRAKSSATFSGVVDGTYRVFYTTGAGFNAAKKRFSRNADYRRFDDSLRFRTTATTSSIWTVSIKRVVGGNARSTGISPGDFPA